MSAPASAKAGMNLSGSSIMRWQSSGSLVIGRMALTTGGPKVMLGTKWPSMTSTWTMVPPPRSARGDLVGEVGEVRGEDGEGEFDHVGFSLAAGALMMSAELLRLDGAVERDAAIDAWLEEQRGELGAMARKWFAVMRGCGDEVREVFHDGCANACFGDVPFGYVNVFAAHVNVGFFQGAGLKDPAGLLQGEGKRMRHVKLRVGESVDGVALRELIEVAYADVKARVERG